MGKILFTLMMLCVFSGYSSEKNYKYPGKTSLIEWQNLSPKGWLDFEKWKYHSDTKDKVSNWRAYVQYQKNREGVGVVVDCVGSCEVYRGLGKNRARFLSKIKEGDDIFVGKDSFLWVFLYDGSLVKISSKSSISIKEINISSSEIFFHLRLNFGHMSFLSRTGFQKKVDKKRETDALFSKIKMYGANTWEKQVPTAMYKDVLDPVDDSYQKDKVDHLNSIIDTNKQIKMLDTYLFLVLPNGTIFTSNPQIEAVSLLGGESYFLDKSFEEINEDKNRENRSRKVFFRGHQNQRTKDFDLGKWYKFDSFGRSIEEVSNNKLFPLRFLTRKITTLNVGRELLFNKYGREFHEHFDEEFTYVESNYRPWGKINEKKSDLYQRLEFLKEYTRRVETTNMQQLKRLDLRLKERGKIILQDDIDTALYSYGVDEYFRAGNYTQQSVKDDVILNSETKKLWKIMHAGK